MNERAPTMVGRYAIYDRIAAGGMATVHLGRLVGERGFSRTVAIKRLHPHYSLDPDFVAMFLDEARLAARIRHPNVVQTLDVVVSSSEVFLVMDYVEGDSLAHLFRVAQARRERVPLACASAVISAALRGLHAAHEAKNDHGEPLDLVHRDVSPQNILVGVDGIPRVLDFGVAKALGQSHSTRDGQLKGKLAYMAPEQIESGKVDRRTDIFAASIVLWELLVGARLFKADTEVQMMKLVLYEPVVRPSVHVPDLPPALEEVVMRGLERDPAKRFDTAEQMADALEDAVLPAPSRKLGAWAKGLLGDNLAARARLVREIESASTSRPLIDAPLPSFELPPDTPREPLRFDPYESTVAMDSSVSAAAAQQPGSQASSIAVEKPRRASDPPRRSRAPLWLAAAGAVALGVVGLGVALRGMRSSATGDGGDVAAAVTPQPAAAAAPAGSPTQPTVPAAGDPATPPHPPVAAAPPAPATGAPQPAPPPAPPSTAGGEPAAAAAPASSPAQTSTVAAAPSPPAAEVARRPTQARPPPPAAPRPQQPAAPAPSAKLYSRF